MASDYEFTIHNVKYTLLEFHKIPSVKLCNIIGKYIANDVIFKGDKCPKWTTVCPGVFESQCVRKESCVYKHFNQYGHYRINQFEISESWLRSVIDDFLSMENEKQMLQSEFFTLICTLYSECALKYHCNGFYDTWFRNLFIHFEDPEIKELIKIKYHTENQRFIIINNKTNKVLCCKKKTHYWIPIESYGVIECMKGKVCSDPICTYFHRDTYPICSTIYEKATWRRSECQKWCTRKHFHVQLITWDMFI